MSPERPPSQDSGGGNLIESTNMVLSSIPLDSGHVVIQHHPATLQTHQLTQQTSQQSTHQQTITSTLAQQVHRSSPQIIATATTHHQSGVITTSSSPPTSKYVVFHNNGHYATEANGTGNILLVATEPMEVNSSGGAISGSGQNIIVNTNGTDEELTSLTWLHDKNLLKGIVSCTNGKSAGASPARQSNGGTISPTSDFLEDSSVSEDNASSANSSSDQGIGIHSNEHSPIAAHNGFTVHQHHLAAQPQSPHHHFHQNHTPRHHHIQYTSSNNINTSGTSATSNNNNNSVSKNRNHLMPSSAAVAVHHAPINVSTATSPVIVHQDQHINGNAVGLTPLGATTTVHVGPSGTTTVVEYKTGTNFIPARHFSHMPTSPQRSPPPGSTIVVTSAAPTLQQTPSSTTHQHQHFHKKYLREQMNTSSVAGGGTSINAMIDQQQQTFMPIQQNGGCNGTVTNGEPLASPNHHSYNSLNTTAGSSIADSDDYQRTPVKGSANSYIYGSHDDLSKESQYDYTNGVNGGVSKAASPPKSSASPKHKHPTNLPYDPMVHTNNKPPYSFSSLIFMAIEDSPEKALPVKEIYAWIVQHFPYFKTAPTGWKNSVRHNLSLNKSFLKVEKAPNMGKGSLWRVEQQQRPNLIQALTRSPFFPCAAVDKVSPYKNPSTPRSNTESPPATPTKSTLDARLFPKLSKMIKEMVNKGNCCPADSVAGDQEQQNHQQLNNSGTSGYYSSCGTPNSTQSHYDSMERLARDCGADSIDDVNAATAMLALKHGPKVFSESFQNGSPVITSSPSEDHTYSAGGGGTNGVSSGNAGSVGSSINGSVGMRSQNSSDNNSSSGTLSDAAYESSEESQTHHITEEELEAQRRHAEGVDALLSFASKVSSLTSSTSTSPVKRPASTSLDDEHIASYTENIPHYSITSNGSSTSALVSTDADRLSSGGSSNLHSSHHNHPHNLHSHQQQLVHLHHSVNHFDTQSYYNQSPPKKLKTSRSLRTKLKRKSTSIR